MLIAMVAVAFVALAGCQPARQRDLVDVDRLVFQVPYDTWKGLVANQARLGRARYPSLRWTHTHPACSAPLVGDGPFDFSVACIRHDFAWGNLKQIDARHPRAPKVWNGRNKNAADRQFLDDLRQRCGELLAARRPACRAAAAVYFSAVNLLPPYASPADARTQGFRW